MIDFLMQPWIVKQIPTLDIIIWAEVKLIHGEDLSWHRYAFWNMEEDKFNFKVMLQ
jgi:hypothetical protein